eukprot:2410269-Pyramimonas_sp.AAC.1
MSKAAGAAPHGVPATRAGRLEGVPATCAGRHLRGVGARAEEVCQIGAAPQCGLRHWDLMRSSLWGHEACEGVPQLGRRRHADCVTGTLGGVPERATKPYGAAKRVRGVPKWGGAATRLRHWDLTWSS